MAEDLKEFAHPQRLTGNPSFDIAALHDYVWELFRVIFLERGGILQGDDVTTGKLTFGAAATIKVTQTNVKSTSRIFLFPANAAAATLVSGSKSPYVSAQVEDQSFTVATADGTAAAGTEQFNYVVIG